MYILKAPNINGSVIAVTNVATPIFDLINTAASTTLNDAGYNTEANAIDINAEDGDFRFTLDGSTPTASKGVLVKQGSMLMLRGVPLKAMRLIRTGGTNVSCSLQIGRSALGESSAISKDAFSGSTITVTSKTGANTSSVGGTVAATNAAGGTQIIAANATRSYAVLQNNGSVDVYFGAGTVTSSFPKVVPGGVFRWDTVEAVKVLSSGVDCNIAFIDNTV